MRIHAVINTVVRCDESH